MSPSTVVLDSFLTFGSLLKYLRRREQLTQLELSVAVGYSEAQISRLENDHRPPEDSRLVALFVPALHLEDEPEIVARLLALGARARGETPLEAPLPASPALEWTLPPRMNLAPPLTSFIGREQEITEVCQRVLQHRLVTVTGAGGVGKTRLALRAAEELLAYFPDGVWLVELAPLSDPAFAAPVVASSLGVRELPGQDLLKTLAGYLSPRHLLLVLDNCEHLVSAVAGLAAHLLRHCSQLHILATSRTVLGEEGELPYRCPSLSLPQEGALFEAAQAEGAALSEAVRLFIERAQMVQPEFRLSAANAGQVARICQRLDGIPLAIELAAARMRMLSVEQITAYLEQDFALLTGGSRSTLPRHQTLQATIDWSYHLLSPEEQLLLQRLSVFAGEWDLEAAEDVCADPAQAPAAAGSACLRSEEVMDVLGRLIDKSLVQFLPSSGEMPRYRMLEMVRQYAQEKLAQRGEEKGLRDRHLDYFLRLLAQPSPPGLDAHIRWESHIRMDLSNLRLAVQWSLETNLEAGMALVVHLFDSTDYSDYSELYDWMARIRAADAATINAAAQTGLVSNQPGQPLSDFRRRVARGRLLNAYGELSMFYGLQDESLQALLESKAIFEGIGEPAEQDQADTYLRLGCLVLVSDPEQSFTYLHKSLTLSRKFGEGGLIPHTYFSLGYLYCYQGNWVEGRRYAEMCVQSSREAGYFGQEALGYQLLGQIAFTQGDTHQACEFIQRAQDQFQKIDLTNNVAWTIVLQAWTALAQGSDEQVQARYAELEALGRQKGNNTSLLYSQWLLAWLEWTQGKHEQAVRRAENALATLSKNQFGWVIGVLYVLGRAALSLGELDQAEAFFRRYDALADTPRWWFKGYSLHLFGLLAAVRNQAGRAAMLFGAQEHLFPWLANVLAPTEREAYARALDGVRAALGEAAFAADWQAGHCVTLGQAAQDLLEQER